MNASDRPPIAEVISIGDEMTSGARVDTNAAWLSRRLGELGFEVRLHTTVGDTLADNVDVFRAAAARSDVIVSTGGLGPTRDDLTREALANAAGVELELRPDALAHIESMFARRGREMPPRNDIQAMFPVGSRQIFNPQGTAPGIDLSLRQNGRVSRVFALPGVPAEMKSMFDETVAPRLASEHLGGRVIRQHVMKLFGTGESDMEARLGDLIDRRHSPRVGITVSSATISLRITAVGPSETDCVEQIETTRRRILDAADEYHFGDGEGFEQQHAIDAALRDRNERIGTIEIGRAAPLADWFAELPEPSRYAGGLVLPTEAALARWADADDCESAATEFCRRLKSDHVLIVNAYPPLTPIDGGPLPAAEVRLSVGSADGTCRSTTQHLAGHPSILQARIAKAAMAWFRRCHGRPSHPGPTRP